MVVALSHNPPGSEHKQWEAAISVLRQYFYAFSRSQNTSWLFLASSSLKQRRLVSDSLGAELPVKRVHFMSFCFVPVECV